MSEINLLLPESSIRSFHQDKRREGFVLLEEGPSVSVRGSAFRVVPFLEAGEEFIPRELLFERAARQLTAGQHHAEWMLRLQDRIPMHMRGWYLVFPATRWEGPDGRVYLPVMSWDTDKRLWTLGFHWSDWIGWRGKGRLVTFHD